MGLGTKKGFTLIELLVVISIIALLMSIMVPALSKVKALGKDIVCSNNLRQLMTAQIMYQQDHDVFAHYLPNGTAPIRLVYPYLNTESLWNPGQAAPGEEINLEPYVCPEQPPAIKLNPKGEWPNIAQCGNMFPYGWNSHLGHYYYGHPENPPVTPKGLLHIDGKPSEIFGWADSACIVAGPKEAANTGVIHGPGSYGWNYPFRGNDVIILRHGSRTKVLATDENYQDGDVEVGHANISFLDGHCEKISLKEARNEKNYSYIPPRR